MNLSKRTHEIVDGVEYSGMFTPAGDELLRSYMRVVVVNILSGAEVLPKVLATRLERVMRSVTEEGHREVTDTEPRAFMYECVETALLEVGLELHGADLGI